MSLDTIVERESRGFFGKALKWMGKSKALRYGITGIAAVVAYGGADVGKEAFAQERKSRIAFESDRDGDFEIYVMDPDGTNVVNLTNNAIHDRWPTWSPDGTRIAFISGLGNSDVYIMDANGKNQERVTTNSGDGKPPQWSPDGKKFAFVSYRSPGTGSDIHIIDMESKNVLRLTDDAALDIEPRWSPDGSRIAFVSERDGKAEIYTMDSAGKNIARLTNNADLDFSPRWSPDGTKITFESFRDGIHALYAMDANGMNQVRLALTRTDTDHQWSPDGKKIVFNSIWFQGAVPIPKIHAIDANGSNLTRLSEDEYAESQPVWSADGENILFVSHKGSGISDIYAIDVDGKDKIMLTSNTGRNSSPSLEPLVKSSLPVSDTGKIVFVSNSNLNSEIYVMDIDGNNKVKLTNTRFSEGQPSWSPDGRKIVFRSNDGGNSDIYTMDADGNNLLRLTDHPAIDSYPDWSPDGRKIAFESNRNNTYGQIHVMDIDGSNVVRLTNDLVGSFHPDWSPDGKKIAFSSWRDGNSEIYIMDADGSSVVRLTNSLFADLYPSWSPDGRKIAFTSFRQESQGINQDIYVMDADGANIMRLTDHPADDEFARWSLDGRKIVFSSKRDGNSEIYVMDADGRNTLRLTVSDGEDKEPDWGQLVIQSPFTIISNDITSDATWKKEGSPYVIRGELAVHNNARLVIEQGCKVQEDTSGINALRDYSFVHNSKGHIIANGVDFSGLNLYLISKQTIIQNSILRGTQITADSITMTASSIKGSTIWLKSNGVKLEDIVVDGASTIGLAAGIEPQVFDKVNYAAETKFAIDGPVLFKDWTIPNLAKEYRLLTIRVLRGATLMIPPGITLKGLGDLDDNAGNQPFGAIVADSSSFSAIQFNLKSERSAIRHSTIRRGAIRINGSVIMENNTLSEIVGSIVIDGGNPTIRNNEFDGNFYFANTGNTEVNAESNYWGDPSGPYHKTLNPEGKGVNVTGLVDFTPWLIRSPFDTTSIDTVISSKVSKIAFISSREGHEEIYAMDIDGRNQVRLTNNNGRDLYPDWSPDGTRIAFMFTIEGDDEIYVIDANGRNQRRLTNSPGIDWTPRWSPDGSKIAFHSQRYSSDEIYIMDTNGNLPSPVTYSFQAGSKSFPAWSPDGERIAFFSFGYGLYVIKLADRLAVYPTRLGYGEHPNWSPDGKIAYTSTAAHDTEKEIYTMDADGSNQVRLTNNTIMDWYPSWSPDGKKIAFSSTRDGKSDIYAMDADGKNQIQLTTSGNNYHPDWSPFLTRVDTIISLIAIDLALSASSPPEHYLGNTVRLPVRLRNEGAQAIGQGTKALILASYADVPLDRYITFENRTIVLPRDLSPNAVLDTSIAFWATLEGEHQLNLAALLFDKDSFFPGVQGQHPVIKREEVIKDGSYNLAMGIDRNPANNTAAVTMSTPETGYWQPKALVQHLLKKMGLGGLGKAANTIFDIHEKIPRAGLDDKDLATLFEDIADVTGRVYDPQAGRAVKIGVSIATQQWLQAGYRAFDYNQRDYLRVMTVGMPLESIVNIQESHDQMLGTAFLPPPGAKFSLQGTMINENGVPSGSLGKEAQDVMDAYITDASGKRTGIRSGRLVADIPNSAIVADSGMIYILTSETGQNVTFAGSDIAVTPYVISTDKKEGTVRSYPIGTDSVIAAAGVLVGVINTSDYGLQLSGSINATIPPVEQKEVVTDISDVMAIIPRQFLLQQNFPNPFNPSTTIRYDLPQRARVRLTIHDILGREVATLAEGEQSAGSYQMLWDGRDSRGNFLPTGIYISHLQAGQLSEARKMLLMK